MHASQGLDVKHRTFPRSLSVHSNVNVVTGVRRGFGGFVPFVRVDPGLLFRPLPGSLFGLLVWRLIPLRPPGGAEVFGVVGPKIFIEKFSRNLLKQRQHDLGRMAEAAEDARQSHDFLCNLLINVPLSYSVTPAFIIVTTQMISSVYILLLLASSRFHHWETFVMVLNEGMGVMRKWKPLHVSPLGGGGFDRRSISFSVILESRDISAPQTSPDGRRRAGWRGGGGRGC